MSNPQDEVQRIWKEQSAEAHRVPLEEIRAKARRFQTRNRWWKMAGATVVIVLVIGNSVEVLWPDQGIVERTGDLLSLAAFLYISYQYRKDTHLSSRPEGLGATNCIDFYRAQLVQERDLAGRSRQYLLPFVPGVALSLMGGTLDAAHQTGRIQTGRMIAVAVFGVALFMAVAWLNAHTARKLQKEIDALDAV